MRFVLFVEGPTEQKAVPAFLKRWLDPRLKQQVGIQPVQFEGWAELVREVRRKAALHLNGPKSADVIAVVSLLDLYGPTIYPADKTSVADRISWGKQHIERMVAHDRFRHFFAVHETEAWLLSQPELLHPGIGESLLPRAANPETVNFNDPPARLLNRIYNQKTGKNYKKVAYGRQVFAKLDPEVAYQRCPQLKVMLDELLRLAVDAGLGA